MQFSFLPSKVERLKERLRKYMEKIETERSFFLDYTDDYLHVADQRFKLSCSTWAKGLERLTTEEQKQNFLQIFILPFLKDFLTEIDLAFKKSDIILCAFEVLDLDNLNKQ